jgi:SAM-dependent methyltransferase
MNNSLFYDTDLAYVHDVGYGNFARQAAKMIKNLFSQEFPEKGLVIDLGCGSGIVAKELLDAGFKVLGIDKSQALIEIAKSRAPNGEYFIDSFFKVNLPKCIGVISTGECLNYATNAEDETSLKKLFNNVFTALEEGGLFIFDMIEPATARDEKYLIENEDWTIFLHKWENQENILTRDITLFRKMKDNVYRKSKEIHKVRLYPHDQIISLLKNSGFQVSLFKQYDDLDLAEHHFGFKCKKDLAR